MTQPNILIISARFYTEIADALEAGAMRVLKEAGANVTTIAVPGAFEIPSVIAMNVKNYDGFIALGCVIRGETTHYDYVCGESARALMDLSVREKVAIGYGILTVENDAQAWERADMNKKDKGGDVAKACLRMIEIKQESSKN